MKLQVFLARSLFLATMSLTISTYAFGPGEGGGGDASEIRVDEIRADILDWIGKGGAAGLTLPAAISYSEYVARMTEVLQPKKVVVSFVRDDGKRSNKSQVSIQGTAKTCRGFVSKIDSKPHIQCGITRFKNTSEADQYKLIHHEFAGLANIERNEGAASDYELSAQITNFLTKQFVLKLAVQKPSASYAVARSANSFDPIRKLEEGKILYAQVQSILRTNRAKLPQLQGEMRTLENQMLSVQVKSEPVRELIKSCVHDMRAEVGTGLTKLDKTFVQELSAKVDGHFESLKSNVNKYLQVENCSDCDAEVKKDLLTKYAETINQNIHDLRADSRADIDDQFYRNYWKSFRFCNFDSLFNFEDENSMKKITHMMSGKDVYDTTVAGLSAQQVGDPSYAGTLDFIAAHAPITVTRDAHSAIFGWDPASSFGVQPSSYFTGNKVVIHFVVADYAGYRPELANAIEIIRRDRK